MSGDLILKYRADFLNSISQFVQQPILRSRYRCDANTILERINGLDESTVRTCPKCLLQPLETKLVHTIKPEVHNHFRQKYSGKQRFTKYQLNHVKQLHRMDQHLIVTCSTCKNKMKVHINKPKKAPKSEVIAIHGKPTKNKRKKKKKKSLAGIDQSAVEEAQKLIPSTNPAFTKDFVSLELTPAKNSNNSEESRKRKLDEVIVIDDTPNAKQVQQANKKPKILQQQQNQPKCSKNQKKNFLDLNELKQEVKTVQTKLHPLATRKEKKKQKFKLKKLQDCIKNFEHGKNSVKNTLQGFLSTLST